MWEVWYLLIPALWEIQCSSGFGSVPNCPASLHVERLGVLPGVESVYLIWPPSEASSRPFNLNFLNLNLGSALVECTILQQNTPTGWVVYHVQNSYLILLYRYILTRLKHTYLKYITMWHHPVMRQCWVSKCWCGQLCSLQQACPAGCCRQVSWPLPGIYQ